MPIPYLYLNLSFNLESKVFHHDEPRSRQELVGILNLPRNKKMRKAGIKESHLAKIVDVYRGVMFNALARLEEDEAGPAGSLGEAEDKGVRVSLFTTALGISPYMFMREVRRVFALAGKVDERLIKDIYL